MPATPKMPVPNNSREEGSGGAVATAIRLEQLRLSAGAFRKAVGQAFEGMVTSPGFPEKRLYNWPELMSTKSKPQ